MKQLHLKGEPPAVPVLYGKDRLIQDIRDFVGTDGLVPFEHGFRPSFNAWAVTDKVVKLRHAIGRERRREVVLEELDENQLRTIILDLFRYLNWCHLYA